MTAIDWGWLGGLLVESIALMSKFLGVAVLIVAAAAAWIIVLIVLIEAALAYSISLWKRLLAGVGLFLWVLLPFFCLTVLDAMGMITRG